MIIFPKFFYFAPKHKLNSVKNGKNEIYCNEPV